MGDDLFTIGQVFAGPEVVANTSDDDSARFVAAVLRHDPSLTVVQVPVEAVPAMQAFAAESDAWRQRFNRAALPVLESISDTRLRKLSAVAPTSYCMRSKFVIHCDGTLRALPDRSVHQ